VSDIQRIDQNARRSRAVLHSGVLYMAGQVPDDRGVDVAGQTKQVLDKIDALLADAGTDKTRVLSAQIWLQNIEDVGAMNQVWDEWVVKGQTPARCCGKVQLNDPQCLVEIAVIAALKAE
jgi:enamine deaminase RidA (YjgF/YER057c/UK114 family)